LWDFNRPGPVLNFAVARRNHPFASLSAVPGGAPDFIVEIVKLLISNLIVGREGEPATLLKASSVFFQLFRWLRRISRST